MYTVPIMLYPLRPYLTRAVTTASRLDSVEGILLLEDNTPLSSKYIYIGSPDAVANALSRLPSKRPITLLSAGDSDELVQIGSKTDINLFVFTLSLVPLYNKVQQELSRYLNWTKDLNEIILSDRGIQKLAEKGYEMIGHPVMILNMGFKLLGGSVPDSFNDPLLLELIKNGFLSYESVCTLVDEEAQLTNPFAPKIEYISPRNGNRTIVRRIYYSGNLIARVIITLQGSFGDEYYSQLATDLAEYVQHYFLNTKASQYMASTEIGTLISDLIEFRLTDPEELEHRLKLVPAMTVDKYYHALVMSFEERTKAIPWNYVISQIEQIFPQSCITVYRNDIIILAKKFNHNGILSFDHEKLMEILKFYDAYLAIGNYSKFLTSLRPIYIQTKTTIRLGRVFRSDPEKRIFYYEEYSMYHTIDLCADVAHDGYHNGNLIYLCHPSLIGIERYDKKYGTNLKETLNVYLNNDCNTVKAAKLMYVHRNTMYYKINKIEELIGQKLDNGILKERLMFSFHVLEYMAKYTQEDPFVLKRHFDDF